MVRELPDDADVCNLSSDEPVKANAAPKRPQMEREIQPFSPLTELEWRDSPEVRAPDAPDLEGPHLFGHGRL